MKNLILALVLVMAPLGVVTTQTGCATSQQQIAYKTLAATQSAVASARKAFLDQYAAGKVDTDTARKALQASQDFNAAFYSAILVAKTSQAPTPESVAVAASQFLTIVAAFIK